MTEQHARALATGSADADAVSAARDWLVRQGVPVPEVESPDGRVRVGRGGQRRPNTAPDRASPEAESRPVPEPDDEARSLQEQADRGADGDPVVVARSVVLRKLAAQARTRHELTKALAARSVPEPVAEEVLDHFTDVGLVDDAGFAHDWVQSRQQRRHLSASALRRELQTKGVSREIVDDAVAQVAVEDELSAATALAEKKYRTVSALPREVQYRRLAAALARRGFNGQVTATVLATLLTGRPTD